MVVNTTSAVVTRKIQTSLMSLLMHRQEKLSRSIFSTSKGYVYGVFLHFHSFILAISIAPLQVHYYSDYSTDTVSEFHAEAYRQL